MGKVVQLHSSDIYQLKITLKGVKPPIWRRILCDPTVKLPDLHKIIQTVMGWTNSHLHQFEIDGEFFSIPDDESMNEINDYTKIKLNRLITEPGSKFIYLYDFGDGWEHEIVLEKIIPREKGKSFPVCIKGARNCPPEDCGGSWGYMDILEIIKDPSREEYEDIHDWLGGDFDPEEFNAGFINEFLQEDDYGCLQWDD